MLIFSDAPPQEAMFKRGAADDPDEDGERYEATHCLACSQIHLVNPRTGKIAGEDGD